MNENLKSFQKQFNDIGITTRYMGFNNIIHKFKCFLSFDKDNDNNQIKERKNESKIIIIDHIEGSDISCFVVIFDYTIIFISDINILPNLINDYEGCKVFRSTSKNDKEFKDDKDYFTTILQFSQQLQISTKIKIIDSIWKLIRPSISSYLINKSYQKLQRERLNLNYTKITGGNYIPLQAIGQGNSATAQLVFHCELEQLFIKKKFFKNDISFKREKRNYLKIRHLSIPHYYGADVEKHEILIEYIRGKTLRNFNCEKLSEKDKLNIIFQILLIIEYLDFHHMIYRDLKPNNIFIYEGKQVILLDFDQMVDVKEIDPNNPITSDFGSDYICPELKTGSNSYKFTEDVFSIGVLIYFIFFQKVPKRERIDKSYKDNYSFTDFNQSFLQKICEESTETDPQNRPRITRLIDFFINNVYFNDQKQINNIKLDSFYPYWMLNFINKSLFTQEAEDIHRFLQFEFRLNYPDEYFIQNILLFIQSFTNLNGYPKSFYFLGVIYFEGKYILQNINKALRYFIIAAEQNCLYAQLQLGIICDGNDASLQYFIAMYYYYGTECIKQDISKAIHYLSLAAKQNYAKALYILSKIYFDSKYIDNDINKAIDYLSRAANQNHVDAQYELGMIYLKGEYVSYDLDKAVHYLSLAADQNHTNAQDNLVFYYYANPDNIIKDVNKAIHYLTLTLNHDNPVVLSILGNIYSEDIYHIYDYEKAIYYFTLSASKWKNIISQYKLGLIYYEGKYVERDINKSINYLQLSANRGYFLAQYDLGVIYYNGIYVKRDINKSIHYLTLAAEHNHLYAQNYLGLIYYKGEYVDISKSIYYFTKASDNGFQESQYWLGRIYYEGKYINRDINKSIHYFKLASDNGVVDAQYKLGKIYLKGKYIARDIQKSIYYLKLASDNGDVYAQHQLGMLYYENIFIARDCRKAIYYFSLAAENNLPLSQLLLGWIYFEGNYIERDIKKSIYYLTQSANQDISEAQLYLFFIYYQGKYVKQDINEALRFLNLAVDQHDKYAQLVLSILYYKGVYIKQNINKSLYYLKLAANQGEPRAQELLGCYYFFTNDLNKALMYLNDSAKQGMNNARFLLGVINSSNKYVNQDMKTSIKYYKDASSNNFTYAKNNLAMIYRNGIGVNKTIGNSIELLKESIKLNDSLSMYNLSHIYFYEDNIGEVNYDEIIKLLIKSIYFSESLNLLSIVLVKKYGNITYDIVRHEIESVENNNYFKAIEITNSVWKKIKMNNLDDINNFEKEYERYRSIDFMYDSDLSIINTSILIAQKKKKIIEKGEKINKTFYEGLDLLDDQL